MQCFKHKGGKYFKIDDADIYIENIGGKFDI